MGLDMYLSKRTYVKNWEHMAPEEQHTVTVSGPEAVHIKSERISYIEEEVAYWRKANAIHHWFVMNCQDGVDDCRDAYVSREQLERLHNLCASLLDKRDADPVAADDVAAVALPPQSGFFFGGTDLDDYYWEDVRMTRDALAAAVAEPKGRWSFYYESSW
jgi:hypothetical protein